MNAKKLLLGTLGAMASLGFSGNTFAYYAETTAYDYPAGFYVGLQLGYAETGWKDLNGIGDYEAGFITAPISFTGAQGDYAGRLYVGYDFNEFLALELGFSYFLGKSTTAETNLALPGPIPAGTILYDESMKAYAPDLVAKLSLPLDNGFRLFTKFGAQYFVTTKPPTFTDEAPYIFADVDRRNLSIIFGVGASYQLSPAFSLDLAWSFYRGNEQLGTKFMPNVDFYTLGISYKFICTQ